jgi:hypothetical protein
VQILKNQKTMKKVFLLMALCFGTMMANAQISTGESTAKVIRTGNRAQAGNFGLYLGATTDMFNKIGDKGVDFSALPLINLKYMATDNVEYRLGIEWWKSKTSTTAEVPTGEVDSNGNPKTKEVNGYQSEKSYMFYPGLAYHFNNRNLLDVYVGGELPFGIGNYGNGDDDDDYYVSHFRVGLGAFIGLQAYVANLPVAIGCEYGIHGLYNYAGDGNLTADGMTIDKTIGYKKDESQSHFNLGHQVRFTLTYYFNL